MNNNINTTTLIKQLNDTNRSRVIIFVIYININRLHMKQSIFFDKNTKSTK